MEQKYPHIFSDRKFDEWTVGCPVQIKSITVKQNSEKEKRCICVTSCPCGDFTIKSYSAEISILNDRKEVLMSKTVDMLTSPISSDIEVESDKIVYATADIKEVVYVHNGKELIWTNESTESAKKLVEQEIYWQTDPLYEQIKRECIGVTDAKYKPDEHNGYWRCTCGQVNLAESDKCGFCHVSHDWLKVHLSPEYLAQHKEIDDLKSEKQIKREIKNRKEGISDKTKALLILGGFVVVVAVVILTINLIIPSTKYSSAEKALENGEFDSAIAVFTELEDFRDSKERLYDARYKKAQFMTGIEDVYMTDSKKEPWYSIDENGVLTFKKDKYTGSWNNFVVPDMVDGVIVRELDRSFFINCKELTVVTISDCVEKLGEQVFYNCEMLHTVNFGRNVTEIGARAFINCYALESIEIPDTVQKLGLRAFNNCTSLNSVVLGSGISEIGSYQFSYCMSLKKLTLKSPITSVGEFAFTECENFEKIYCRFTEESWNEPGIAEGNEKFESAEISFDN